MSPSPKRKSTKFAFHYPIKRDGNVRHASDKSPVIKQTTPPKNTPLRRNSKLSRTKNNNYNLTRGKTYKPGRGGNRWNTPNHSSIQERSYREVEQDATNWYRNNRRPPIHIRGRLDESERLRELAHNEPKNSQIKARYNYEAANIIIEANNRGRGRPWDQIDLHSLLRNEAEDYVKDILKQFRTDPKISDHDYLTLIVGKGIHSRNGPVLKPAIQNLCKRLGYEFWSGEKEAVVIVKLQSGAVH